MNAITPTLRQSFERNRAAIEAAETPEQIIARLRRQRESEASIRVRAAMARVGAAGGSVRDEWDAGVAEFSRVEREYDALIARHLPPVREDGPREPYDPVFDNTVASYRYFGRL